MLETTSVWKWLLWCNISLWWWTHQNTQVYYFSLQSIFDNIIVWPAYTSLGHGQNFVQKDWVNGLSSHAPDEERIGSTIIIFCHKNKCGSTEEEKMDPVWWLQRGFQRWGVTRRACGAIHEEGSAQVWCLWKALQKKGVPRIACGAVHKGSLVECDLCGKHFRRREYLGEHLVLFMKGFLL